MKKVLTILSALAMTLSLNAQMNGDGSGTMDGAGPHGQMGMWDSITTAIDGVEDTAVKAELDAALAQVTATREVLRTARTENPDMTIDDFRETYAAQIGELKGSLETLQNWWRENRPDRPDPVVTGAMVQRRSQFKSNSQNILQTRKQLHTMDSSDEDYEQVRNQLRQYLGERKQLMREQRRGEGGPSGEGNGGSRGG